MSREAIVRLTDLTVRYGPLTAVDGLSLEVPKGCVYALLGRNGSGKSSTLAGILRLILTTHPVHVVTIEDPIEFLLSDDVGAVSQEVEALLAESIGVAD